MEGEGGAVEGRRRRSGGDKAVAEGHIGMGERERESHHIPARSRDRAKERERERRGKKQGWL